MSVSDSQANNLTNTLPVCLSHSETDLKKITLVNCLIILILIIVLAANINEGDSASTFIFTSIV